MDTVARTAPSEDSPKGSELSALSWVHAELRRTLDAAHKALRRYVKEAAAKDRDDLDAVDPSVLRSARTQLHQGVGALEMVGQPAAAAMLRAAESLVQRFINRPALATPAAVQAVERVSFALLDFLDRSLAGKPVSALMMFPQYQAALQLSAADRVHPADLWQRPWQWASMPADPRASARGADDNLRGEMETLVLALMREPKPQSFMRLSDLCADLAAGLRLQPGQDQQVTLWQLAAACFEALAAGLLDSDVHTKRLASRLLAQLRQSVRGGGAAIERLAQDLLFFCAHARGHALERIRAGLPPLSPTPRLEQVQRAWNLEDWPTADYSVSRLGLFDPALVALAKRRVASAKDSWSAVAGGEQHRIGGLLEPFALVGESLQKLFHAAGDKLAQALSMAAAHTVASNAAPSPALAMEVATAVLYLEAALEDGELDQPELAARLQHLAGRVDSVRAGADPKPLDIWMEDLYRRVSDRQTMGSVVQELRAALSEVEKQIDQYFRDPAGRAVLIPVPAQLSSMRGVLSVLGLHHASQAALHMRDDVDALIQTVVQPQQAIQTGTFNRLADNLGALSFLIDMLSVQPQMAKSLFRFDPATGSLSAVMGQTERVSAFADLAPDPAAESRSAPAPAPAVGAGWAAELTTTPGAFIVAPEAPRRDLSPPPGLVFPDLQLTLAATPFSAPTAAPASLTERLQILAGDALRASVSDHEIVRSLDLLSEQALQESERGLSATLSQAQIHLRETVDPATSRALRVQLAQAIQQRLSRPATAATERPGTAPSPAQQPSVLDFQRQTAAEAIAPASTRSDATVPATTGTGLEDDAEMREVFIEEAREVIAAADAALERLAQAADNTGDMTEVRRAFHTLKGSSRMVGLRDFGDAAWACEQLYNARLAQMTSLDPAMRSLSQEALKYLGQWVEAIATHQRLGHHSLAVSEAADALRLTGEWRPIPLPAGTGAPAPLTATASAASAMPELRAPEPDAVPPVEVTTVAAQAAETHPVDSELQRWVPSLPSAADLDLALQPALDPVEAPIASAAPAEPALVPDVDLRIDEAAAPAAAQAAADLDIELELQQHDADHFAATLALPDPLPPATPLAAGPMLSEPMLDIELDAEDVPLPLPAVQEFEKPVGPEAVNLDVVDQQRDQQTLVEQALVEHELAELDQFFGFTPDPDARFGRPTEPGDLPPQGAAGLIDLLSKVDPGALSDAGPAVGWHRVSGHFEPLDLVPELDPVAAEARPEPESEPGPAPEPKQESVHAAAALVAPDPGFEDEPFKAVGPLRISIPLFNIFLNEADELSRRLVTELAEWALEWHVKPVPQSSAALAHALAGSSGTVGGADLCALARGLEHALTRSAETGLGRGRAGEAELFSEAAEEIRRLLHQFAAGFLREVAPGMMERLAAHERWPAPAPEDRDTMLPAVQPLVDFEGDAAAAADVGPGLTETSAHAQNMATSSQPMELPPPLLEPASAPAQEAGVTSSADPLASHETALDVSPVPAPPVLGPAPIQPGTVAPPMHVQEAGIEPAAHAAPTLRLVSTGARADAFDDDRDIDAQDAVDRELFPIFEEEADELLPQLQQRLRDWMHQPADASQPAACMRTLHTFKGGARLAGAMRLGEMAHRLETAIEHLAGRAQLQAADVVPLLARADAMSTTFDELRKPVNAPAAVVRDDTLTPAARPDTVDAWHAGSTASNTGPLDLEPDLGPDPVLEALEATRLHGVSLQPEASPTAPPSAPGAVAIDWSRFTLAAQRPAPPIQRPAAVPVRVRAALLDRLVNQAGEVSITRARIDSDVRTLQGSLADLTESLERMRRQLRDIEVQAETQISSRLEAAKAASQIFDPLEMDRFTRFQELTRFMAESVNDVATLQRSLQRTLQSAEDELAAQARLTRELQDDLLRTRMVEFESAADRLYRTVRQATKDSGKSVKLEILGGAIEVDRGVLERMIGSFEHLLRNCVAHGIEGAEERLRLGKPADGRISISVTQAGNEVVVEFADDGAGLDLERIHARAVQRGLLEPDAQPGEAELVQLIFQSGFSTAEQVTELSGRGVGLDVVRAEVVAMGGSIETLNRPGQGTSMRLRLPLTTAVTQVVILRCGNERVAVPTTLVELVRRVPTGEVLQAYRTGQLVASYGGTSKPATGPSTVAADGAAADTDARSASSAPMPFFWLSALLHPGQHGQTAGRSQTVVILRSAQQRVAVHVDEVLGNQEVVVKNVGPQLAHVPGLAGVTLLPSGAVALIYNPVALANVYGAEVRRQAQHWAATGHAPSGAAPDVAALAMDPDGPTIDAAHAAQPIGIATAPTPSNHTSAGLTPASPAPVTASVQPPLVMVVDDSLTVRRVTQRLLQREGYRVVTAKDGLDAMERLALERPAVLLSDIEMPRMDGFDLLRNVRADAALGDLPVAMVTSRIAQKHRDHALALGANQYFGKPFAEDELLAWVAQAVSSQRSKVPSTVA